MGSWDVYCAGCGGPFGYMVKIAAARRRRLRPSPGSGSTSGINDGTGANNTNSEGEDIGVTAAAAPENGDTSSVGGLDPDEGASEDRENRDAGENGDSEDEDEGGCYDPDLVTEDDVAWT